MTWPHSQVLQALRLDGTTDKTAYADDEPIVLILQLRNTGISSFEVDAAQMQRRARVLFMERAGRGEHRVRLATLFGRPALRLPPGGSLDARLTLRAALPFDRDQVEHYEFPDGVRTFQVFLPVSDEDARDFDHMISCNLDGVSVVDRWSDPTSGLGIGALSRALWRRLLLALGLHRYH